MRYRAIFASVLLLLGACWFASAQRIGVREEVRADWIKSSGLDCVIDWSPKQLTPAPEGYEAVYVEHYGRHGSRYAYTARAYTILLRMLRAGRDKNNLTDYGAALLDRFEKFYAFAEHRVGDLTPLGWNQHQEIAKTMVSSFPTAFPEDCVIDACSSASERSIVSMSSFCVSLARILPKADIYAHQSNMDIQATRPNMGVNPFKYSGPDDPFPFPESSEEFFLRRFPNYNDVLARLFKDTKHALGKWTAYDAFFNLYMFVGGMNSLPEDVRFDVSDFFTVEEYATLWETDNYERYREYRPYRTSCSSIVDDIVAKADARLASCKRGADLRFGHDHVVMALLMVMDIDDFDVVPEKADDLVLWFQTFRSPMAANIQLVFYEPKCCAGKHQVAPEKVLVKVLLNGEEARFGKLPTADGPYYRWSDLKSYFTARTAKFVYR